jgi:hypothetical protein
MTIKKQARDYKMPSQKAITAMDEFSKTLDEWDRMESEVDLKDLCQKLQEALAKSYVEAEELEKQMAYWRNEVNARDIVIRYLESRRA